MQDPKLFFVALYLSDNGTKMMNGACTHMDEQAMNVDEQTVNMGHDTFLFVLHYLWV